MRFFDADEVARMLPYDQLIDALDTAFRTDTVVPLRSHHGIAVPGSQGGTLLLMPAWVCGDSLGVKIVNVFPDNAKHGLPAVHATYLLMNATTGVMLALLDGTELTLRRTACASALASRYLSRHDSRKLLMVGTGKLAPHLIAAHAAVRRISEVRVWGRRKEAAQSLADEMADMPFDIAAVDDLRAALDGVDIVSCATLANDPLIHGSWLQPGQHVDLVGAFTPRMREADFDALRRAEVFVDTCAGAMAEAGEIVQALERGDLAPGDIRAELAGLARGEHAGRTSDSSITLFKSVGTALEDLAAARLVAGADA
jgi:ornithine cyclodeaminase/alanine dehydrogenase-like protein (mu-crystallin family)